MFSTILSPEYYLPSGQIYSATSGAATIDLSVSILPEWYRELDLTWKVPSAWALKAPRFNIYRSEIEHDGFQKLNAVPITTPFFKDLSTLESSKHSLEYYVVEAVLNDGTVWRTPVAHVGDRLPRWHDIRMREIQRREWILLRKFAGVEASVLRQVRYGAPCPECLDRVSNKLMKDYCKTCYGTGVEGGYYSGFKTFLQFDASQDSMTYTYFGRMEVNQIGAWTIQVPALEPLDIVIRHKDFKIFRIKNVSNTEIQNKVSRQIMVLDEQPKESVLYELLKREGLNG